jgi:hypothetical protein
MRRNEVMSLRGEEVIVEEKRIIIRGRVKGCDYQGREAPDRRVRAALLDCLRSGRRFASVDLPHRFASCGEWGLSFKRGVQSLFFDLL